MAFRSDDQDFRWPPSGGHPQEQEKRELARGDAGESLSLPDTLRELAVTIVGFVGVILLIAAAVNALHS